jgi:RHS repeat-associated protein
LLVEADPNGATAMCSYHPQYADAIAHRMRDADCHVSLADDNWNVTAMVNVTVGNSPSLVERYNYSPYGEVTVLNADFSVDPNGTDIANEILYTGRWRDSATGLQLNRNRFYASHLGRWLSRDPIRYRGGMNLYGYVSAMPTRYKDPSGLIVQDVGYAWGDVTFGDYWHWLWTPIPEYDDDLEDALNKTICLGSEFKWNRRG